MALTEVVGLCHLVAMLSLLIFCTQDMAWSTVLLETVANSRVTGVSPLQLGLFRWACASVVWGTVLFITLTGKPLFLMVLLRDGNKRMVSLIGPQRFAMFTVWCWTLQGIYFPLAAYCSFAQQFAQIASPLAAVFPLPSRTLLYITQVLFEISFPVSFMVSAVVTFVLIPHSKNAKMPTDNFYVIVPLLMHNANIIFMGAELILNKIPFVIWHFPFVALYCISYAMFSWKWNYYKGYYFYYFMDYTRKGAILWYLLLTLIASTFFLVGYGCSLLMNSSDTATPSVIIALLTAMVIKVSD